MAISRRPNDPGRRESDHRRPYTFWVRIVNYLRMAEGPNRVRPHDMISTARSRRRSPRYAIARRTTPFNGARQVSTNVSTAYVRVDLFGNDRFCILTITVRRVPTSNRGGPRCAGNGGRPTPTRRRRRHHRGQ